MQANWHTDSRIRSIRKIFGCFFGLAIGGSRRSRGVRIYHTAKDGTLIENLAGNFAEGFDRAILAAQGRELF